MYPKDNRLSMCLAFQRTWSLIWFETFLNQLGLAYSSFLGYQEKAGLFQLSSFTYFYHILIIFALKEVDKAKVRGKLSHNHINVKNEYDTN